MPRPDPSPHQVPPHAAAARARLLASLCLAVSLLPSPVPAAGGPAGTVPPATPPSLTSVTAGLGLTAAEVESLAAGEAVVRPPDSDEPREAAAGLAYRVLPAAAERLSRAVADWDHYAEFFPFVLASEVVPAGDGATRVLQRVDLPFPFPDRRLTLRTSRRADPAATAGRPHHEVTWSHVAGSGNVASQEGSWRLWALEPGGAGAAQRSLVELRLTSDAGAGVPDGLERKALLQTLAWALDGLRQQVNRCRYDLPIHPSCDEDAPFPAAGGEPLVNETEGASP